MEVQGEAVGGEESELNAFQRRCLAGVKEVLAARGVVHHVRESPAGGYECIELFVADFTVWIYIDEAEVGGRVFETADYDSEEELVAAALNHLEARLAYRLDGVGDRREFVPQGFVLSWEVLLGPAIDAPWLDLASLRVGAVPAGLGTPDSFVTVAREREPVLRIDVYVPEDGGNHAVAAILWRGLVVVGYGERVSTVAVESRRTVTHELQGYFGSFHVEGDVLLAASAKRVYRLDRDGNIVWISAPVGIDGVVVSGLADGRVRGKGEWDPPGGWRDFTLDLGTGALPEA